MRAAEVMDDVYDNKLSQTKRNEHANSTPTKASELFNTNRTNLTNLTDSFKVSGMRLYAVASLAKLALAYGFSRQAMHQAHRKYGPYLTSPDHLFEVLVASGRQSPIRTLLSDPAERSRITEAIFTKP